VAVTAVALTIVLGTAATGWIGTTLPGFFVLPNRVVASVGLTSWSGARDADLYQRTLVAVEGSPVEDAGDVYRRVRGRATSEAVTYAFRSGAATEVLALRAMVFTRLDYWLVFGSYMVCGATYVLLGLLGAWWFQKSALGRALLWVGATGGLFALSAVAMYEPGHAIRVNALAEALFPAALVNLALVYPRQRGGLAATIGTAAWWLSLALAVPYQFLLPMPAAYSVLHGACELYLGIAGAAFIGVLTVERARDGEAADRLLRCVLASALLGLGVPAVVMTSSGATGGPLPVNVCGLTAFLFPLGFAYGVVREAVAGQAREPVVAMR
jgi:hypothetical protein